MIRINQTYSTCTPESAEHGDYAESGFIFEDVAHTFRELVELMREHRQPSCSPARGDTFEWLSSGFYVTNYATAEERETAIHYSRSNPERKAKYWRKAMQAAGIIEGAQ